MSEPQGWPRTPDQLHGKAPLGSDKPEAEAPSAPAMVWLKQDGEPAMWFDRFEAFRLQGSRRSLLATYNAELARRGRKKSPYSPGAWRQRAEQFNWFARAEAWDAYERKRQEVLWEERRQQQRDKEWEVAQKLLERAEQMLAFPVAQQLMDENGRITINPARWTFATPGALAEAASKLMRLAVGLPVETVAQVTSEGKDVQPSRLVRELSDDELALIASRGHAADK